MSHEKFAVVAPLRSPHLINLTAISFFPSMSWRPSSRLRVADRLRKRRFGLAGASSASCFLVHSGAGLWKMSWTLHVKPWQFVNSVSFPLHEENVHGRLSR